MWSEILGRLREISIHNGGEGMGNVLFVFLSLILITSSRATPTIGHSAIVSKIGELLSGSAIVPRIGGIAEVQLIRIAAYPGPVALVILCGYCTP